MFSQRDVQCFDTFGGCVAALYSLQLIQSTPFLYDCYLFTAESTTREAYRGAFLQAFDAKKPRILVVTDQACFDTARGFDRVTTWPALDSRLSSEYMVISEWHSNQLQHWWRRPETPVSFRIYARR